MLWTTAATQPRAATPHACWLSWLAPESPLSLENTARSLGPSIEFSVVRDTYAHSRCSHFSAPGPLLATKPSMCSPITICGQGCDGAVTAARLE